MTAPLLPVVTSALHEAAGVGLRLWFVTLTFHPDELDDAWPWQAGDLYASAIGRDGGHAGALLALDVSPHDRVHFHGLVLSRLSQLELDHLWLKLARHCPRRDSLYRRVQHVRGSNLGWSPLHPTLRGNLTRVCRYLASASDWPRDVPKPDLHDRLITSGIFADYLRTAQPHDLPELVTLPGPTSAIIAVQSRLRARLHHECEVCRSPLPEGRRHRRTCSPRCRKAKSRADRRGGGAS